MAEHDEAPKGSETAAPAKTKRGKRAKADGTTDKLMALAGEALKTSNEAVRALKDQLPQRRELNVVEADSMRCTECGQPGNRCKGKHAVIDLVPMDLWAKAWQGINLNGVKYDGPRVTVPAEAAQEMLSRLNNWQRREASRLLPKKQIEQNIATLSGAR